MFKISNTQKVIIDLLGEKYEIVLQCNPGFISNTIDAELAKALKFPIMKPRLLTKKDKVIPISNIEFTLEITSLDGEVKYITGVADVTNHLQKNKKAIMIGSNLLKELKACIVM